MRCGDQPGREQGEHAADPGRQDGGRARRAAGRARWRQSGVCPVPRRSRRHAGGAARRDTASPAAAPAWTARATTPRPHVGRREHGHVAGLRITGAGSDQRGRPRQGDLAELGPPVEQGHDRSTVRDRSRHRRSRPARSPAGRRARRRGRWPRPAPRGLPSRALPTVRRRRGTARVAAPSPRSATISRPRRAVLRQCTRRGSSPCCHSRTPAMSRPGPGTGSMASSTPRWCAERAVRRDDGRVHDERLAVRRRARDREHAQRRTRLERISQPCCTPRCSAIRVMSTSALPPGGSPPT